MAKDWASDVKKFAPEADDGVIAGIVRYCGIALQKPDSSLVSYGDPVELARVRNNFLKKKLALTDPDEVLDAAIARVGERMQGVNFKNRVTVYYLLLEDLKLTHLFAKKGSPAATPGGEPGAGAILAPLSAAGAVAAADTVTGKPEAATVSVVENQEVITPATAEPVEAVAPAPTATVTAAAVATTAAVASASTISFATSAPQAFTGSRMMPSVAGPGVTPHRFSGGDDDGKGVWGWLWLVLLALGLMALFVLLRPLAIAPPDVMPAAPTVASADPADAPDNATAAVAAIAPAPAPDGAGIVSETRADKPVVKVYFDTGKADVAPTFALATEPLKSWLTANPASKLAVSGYNDPTGNAAANAALSKRRAQAVQASLVAAGVPAASIELVKPEAATDTAKAAAEARRVEVYIK